MVKIMMIMVFACFACTNKNKENAVIQLQQIKGDFPVMECTSTDTIPEIIPLKISFHDVSYTDDKGFLVKEIRCKATFDSLYLSTLQESDVITIYVGESTNAQFSKNNITREEGKFTTIFSLGNTNFVKGKEDVLVIVSRQGKEEKYILRDQITKGTYKNGCVYDLFISDVLFPKPGCIIINVSLLTKLNNNKENIDAILFTFTQWKEAQK